MWCFPTPSRYSLAPVRAQAFPRVCTRAGRAKCLSRPTRRAGRDSHDRARRAAAEQRRLVSFRQLWVQNEDTADLPDHVDRRSFGELLGGCSRKPKSPQESLACHPRAPGFKVELVASEPLVKDPIAFEWGAGRQALGGGDGRLSARHRWPGQAGRHRPLSGRHGWRRALRQIHRLPRRCELSRPA